MVNKWFYIISPFKIIAIILLGLIVDSVRIANNLKSFFNSGLLILILFIVISFQIDRFIKRKLSEEQIIKLWITECFILSVIILLLYIGAHSHL